MRIDIHHHFEGAFIVALSPAFQAQLDRLTSGLSTLNAQLSTLQAGTDTGPEVDAADTQALASALDQAGLPAVAPVTSTISSGLSSGLSTGVSSSLSSGVSTTPSTALNTTVDAEAEFQRNSASTNGRVI